MSARAAPTAQWPVFSGKIALAVYAPSRYNVKTMTQNPVQAQHGGKKAEGLVFLFLAELRARGMGKAGLTCIDCHKGIAHDLPGMTGVVGWQ